MGYFVAVAFVVVAVAPHRNPRILPGVFLLDLANSLLPVLWWRMGWGFFLAVLIQGFVVFLSVKLEWAGKLASPAHLVQLVLVLALGHVVGIGLVYVSVLDSVPGLVLERFSLVLVPERVPGPDSVPVAVLNLVVLDPGLGGVFVVVGVGPVSVLHLVVPDLALVTDLGWASRLQHGSSEDLRRQEGYWIFLVLRILILRSLVDLVAVFVSLESLETAQGIFGASFVSPSLLLLQLGPRR